MCAQNARVCVCFVGTVAKTITRMDGKLVIGQVEQLAVNPVPVTGRGGSNPSLPIGRLAQLGEHLPYKQGVAGSSPALPI